MADKRDRVIELKNYIESFGIKVNLKKNTARGNKGFFKVNATDFRIDISKNISDFEILKILVHEFVHYIHYKNDKALSSYQFILDDYDAEPELIKLTVDSLSKSDIKPLFDTKTLLSNEIDMYISKLKSKYPDLKQSSPYMVLENRIKRTDYKYLLKYDNVTVKNLIGHKYYSINDIDNEQNILTTEERNYLKLKSAQRKLKRLNSKISKLNKYYNSPTELLARSFEYFIFKPERMQKLTPILFSKYQNIISLKKNINLSEMYDILN